MCVWREREKGGGAKAGREGGQIDNLGNTTKSQRKPESIFCLPTLKECQLFKWSKFGKNQWTRLSQNWRRQQPNPGYIVLVGRLQSQCPRSQALSGSLHVSSDQDIIGDVIDIVCTPKEQTNPFLCSLQSDKVPPGYMSAIPFAEQPTSHLFIRAARKFKGQWFNLQLPKIRVCATSST